MCYVFVWLMVGFLLRVHKALESGLLIGFHLRCLDERPDRRINIIFNISHSAQFVSLGFETFDDDGVARVLACFARSLVLVQSFMYCLPLPSLSFSLSHSFLSFSVAPFHILSSHSHPAPSNTPHFYSLLTKKKKTDSETDHYHFITFHNSYTQSVASLPPSLLCYTLLFAYYHNSILSHLAFLFFFPFVLTSSSSFRHLRFLRFDLFFLLSVRILTIASCRYPPHTFAFASSFFFS